MARLSRAFALIFLTACPGPKEETKPPYPVPEVETEGKVVAEIGPVQLTTAELEKRIMGLSPFVRAQLKDPDKKRQFVEEQARNELLSQEAWRKELYDDPRVKAEIRRILVQRLMKDYLTTIEKEIDVTEGELLDAYRARTDEFNKPAKIRLSQIVRYTDDDAERKVARKLLEQIQAEVIARQKKNDHEAFAEAARKQSQDENTKLGGGDLQFLTKEELAERYGNEVATHMFDEVKVGDLAIADAPNGVILFKKTGSRRAVERTLEQVKSQIRGTLIGEKRTRAFEAFVDELEKQHGLRVDEQVVDEIRVELNAPTTESEE